MTRAVFLAVVIALACLVGTRLGGKVRAAEARWQVVECPPAALCRPRGAPRVERTACDLDAASVSLVAAKGTRVSCERTTKNEATR